MKTQLHAVEVSQDALGYLLLDAEGHPVCDVAGDPHYYKTRAAAQRALKHGVDATASADALKKQQAYMSRAVAKLQKVHKLSERDAASLMLTVTSVVSLGPKSAT
jgi:hypothetical protein